MANNLIPVELNADVKLQTKTRGAFRFILPEGERIDIAGGQFVTLVLGDKGSGKKSVPRAYSVVNHSIVSGRQGVELYIGEVEQGGRGENGQGLLTGQLFNKLRERDIGSLEFSFHPKAKGNFFLPQGDRPAVIAANGTAIAAAMGLLYQEAEVRSDREIHLFHQVKRHEERPYRSELRELAGRMNLRFHGLVSGEHCSDCPASRLEELFFNREPRYEGERVEEAEMRKAISGRLYENPPIEDIIGRRLVPGEVDLMLTGTKSIANTIAGFVQPLGYEKGKNLIVEAYS